MDEQIELGKVVLHVNGGTWSGYTRDAEGETVKLYKPVYKATYADEAEEGLTAYTSYEEHFLVIVPLHRINFIELNIHDRITINQIN